MGALSPSHWMVILIIGFVLLVVFNGGKKLPDLARGLGRSLRIFKSEFSELQKEDHNREKDTADNPPQLTSSSENETENAMPITEHISSPAPHEPSHTGTATTS